MKHPRLIAIALLLIPLLALVALTIIFGRSCESSPLYNTPTPLPEMEISATPIDTPASAGASSTPTASLTASNTPGITPSVSPPPGTAVNTSTLTAVPLTSTPTPTPAPTERPSSHTVERGEHLSGISELYCGAQNWRWIYRANEERIRDPNLIFAGQRLVLPWPCRE